MKMILKHLPHNVTIHVIILAKMITKSGLKKINYIDVSVHGIRYSNREKPPFIRHRKSDIENQTHTLSDPS